MLLYSIFVEEALILMDCTRLTFYSAGHSAQVCWQIWSKKQIGQSEGGYVINAAGLA